ncbi:hypothetical protein TKK_0010606 [Trichogramma kaykai]
MAEENQKCFNNGEIGRDPNQLITETNSSPLHIALVCKRKEVVELLLRNGANPNSRDKWSLTPLLLICHRWRDADLARMFLQTCKEVGRKVEIDALDSDGQTALEWAVANLLPDMVGVLLYYGADLSNFFFPDEEQFLEVLLTEELDMYGPVDLPAGLMAVIEQLEKRGYRLDLYDVYTMIVILIDGEYNMNLGEAAILCEEEEFANKAKRVLVKPGLSLYDLVGSRAARTAESVTYREYYDFARSKKLNDLAEKYREACALPISESMCNRFFLNWALKTILRVRDEDNDTSGSIVASVLDKYLTLTVVGWSSSPERNVDDIGDCHCTNVYRM